MKLNRYLACGMIGLAGALSMGSNYSHNAKDKNISSEYIIYQKLSEEQNKFLESSIEDCKLTIDEQLKLVKYQKDREIQKDKFRKYLELENNINCYKAGEFKRVLGNKQTGMRGFYNLLDKNVNGIDIGGFTKLESYLIDEIVDQVEIERNFSKKERNLAIIIGILSIPFSFLVYKNRELKLW